MEQHHYPVPGFMAGQDLEAIGQWWIQLTVDDLAHHLINELQGDASLQIEGALTRPAATITAAVREGLEGMVGLWAPDQW